MPPLLEIDPATFSERFDRRPFVVRHHVGEDPLFTLPALVELSQRLPPGSWEYQSGRVAVGLDPHLAPRNGLSLEETLGTIESCSSWVVLKHVEAVPEYRELMHDLLQDVGRADPRLQGTMHAPAAFVFVSSASSVTPYHIDPEHNFLLQIRGVKTMHVWSPEDRAALPEEELERFHAGGHRNLPYLDAMESRAERFDLRAGDALHVPVTAPHWVKNGEAVSISLSVTFRSPESDRREILYRINANLRRLRLRPRSPGAFPLGDRMKLTGYEALRRVRRSLGARPAG